MPEVSPIMIAVVAVLGVFVLVAMLYAKNYIKVPPNQVAVFTGRGKQRIVRGGARFKMPVIERVDIMELEPFSVQVQVHNIIAVDGVPVNVEGVGLIKFGSTDEAIATAVERFLTKDRNELKDQVQEILAGNMRGIVSQMTVEQLNNNREEFRRKVVDEAGADFAKIGMELDVLTIQNISDTSGYLEALGRKRIAEVKRDAEIGEADARRDSMIKSAEADQAGKTAVAQAATAIAQAEQSRDIELARIQAEVEAERATAAQAGPRADAEARKAVVVAEVAAEEARTQAQIAVEKLRAEQAREAQQADVVVPAEAAKQAAILNAEANRQTAVAQAQAEAEARTLAGEADAQARTVAATARQAELVAEAEGEKAKLLAQAEGQREMAEALNAFTEEAARLNVLPSLIEQLPRMAEAVALPLGQIGNMVVLDSGNGNGTDGISNLVPSLLAKTLLAFKAVGLDIGQILASNGKEQPAVPPQSAEASSPTT